MNLSLREKICQSMIVRAEPEKHIAQFGSIENFMKQYPVGGIFVGSEICTYNNTLTGEYDVIREYQKYSKIPLLVCMDGERGLKGIVKGATNLPQQIVIGAANSKQLAYDYGKAIALESAGTGINWTFAPVGDLCKNDLNLIVNGRCIGDEAEYCIPLYKELIRGYKENGLLTTAKHFPGDGIDYRNQHITKSENSLSEEEWWKESGAMFKAAIEAGVDSIMIGHISAPALQNDAIDGNYPPATLSYDLVTKVLKQEMGFDGVVVSDALDMGGFLRWFYEQDEAEVKCFEIGVDMLLWPLLRTVDNIENAVNEGKIPMERVEDAFSRIMNMKSKIKEREADIKARDFSCSTAQRLAQEGTCIIRNSIIPVSEEKIKKVRIVGVSTGNRSEELGVLKREFEKRGAEVEVYDKWCNYHADFSTLDKNYDLLVFAYMLDPLEPNPTGAAAVTIHTSMTFDREKTIVVSFSSPYILKQYCEVAPTYINCYDNEISLETFVKGVYGECEFKGSPSVKAV